MASQYPSLLCARCLEMPWGEQGWQQFHLGVNLIGDNIRTIPYSITMHNLFQSQSCVWCRLLAEELKAKGGIRLVDLYHGPEVFTKLQFFIKFPSVSHAQPAKLSTMQITCMASTEASQDDGTSSMVGLFATFGVVATKGGPASELFLSPSTDIAGLSRFDGALARQWLSDCSENHVTCGKAARPPVKLPARVLDLYPEQAEGFIRLRDTTGEESVEESSNYACLSYTWGAAGHLPQYFTDLARRAYKEPLADTDLAETFRDAVIVARAAGLRYLWIDALCIWQDDQDDKLKNLPVMHEYYRNARLVIQPSGTTSVKDEFLGPKRVPKVSRTLVEAQITTAPGTHHDRDEAHPPTATSNAAGSEQQTWENTMGEEHQVIAIPFLSKDGKARDQILVLKTSGLQWYSAKTEIAASRGWILQEELLCARTLVFPSTGGMIFRCLHGSRPTELHDGNVIFNPDHHFEGGFPQKTLISNAEAEEMGLKVLGRTRLLHLDRARHIVSTGKKSSVSFYENLTTINLDEDPDVSYDSRSHGSVVVPITIEDETGKKSVCPYTAMLYEANTTTAPEGSEDNNNNNDDNNNSDNNSDNNSSSNTLINTTRTNTSRIIYTSLPPDKTTAEEANECWKRIVNDYCRRKLSAPSDKLLAIAALAREFSVRYDADDALGGYLAGMWAKFLMKSLAWYVPHGARQRLPTERRAPSWSWASVDGAWYGEPTSLQVTEESDVFNYYTDEIEVSSAGVHAPSLEAAFEIGPVGFIELRGPMIPCRWSRNQDSDPGVPSFSLTDVSGQNKLGSVNRSYPDCLEYVVEVNESSPVAFLFLHHSNQGLGNPEDAWEGLLLVRHPDKTWVRVGYAKFWDTPERWKELWLPKISFFEIKLL